MMQFQKRSIISLGAMCLIMLHSSGCVQLLRQRPETEGPKLFVVNALNQTVTVLNPLDGKKLKTIDLRSMSPHDIAYLPRRGNVYVVDSAFQQLSIIDAQSQSLKKNILTLPRNGHVGISEDRPCFECHSYPVGGMPVNLVASEDEKLLYVTNTHGKKISVIDTQSEKLIDVIDTDENVLGLALAGTDLWVSNRKNGTVTVIDTNTKRTIKVISVGKLPGFIRSRTVSGEVYVCVPGDAKVVVFDANTKEFKHEIATKLGTRAIAFNEKLGVGYAASYYSDTITLFDLSSGKTLKNQTYKLNPDDVSISEDGSELYISCTGSGELAIADPATLDERKRISAGPYPSDMVIVR